MSLKAPLGRVLGLGTSGGFHHWWLQRVGSVALVPLGLWFLVSLLRLPDLGYATVHAWLAVPFNAILMLLLLPIMAHHAWLGLSTIIEDYVHGKVVKPLSLLLVQFLHLIIGVTAVFAVLKIALGSAA